MLAGRRARPEPRLPRPRAGAELAEELAPKSSSYFEVFLADSEGRSLVPMNPSEPLYGDQYLPRKFKIGIAHGTDNSVDIRTNDIGFMPVDAAGERFDVWTGGGLGMTHNNPRTAPLLAEYVGRVARAILLLQKCSTASALNASRRAGSIRCAGSASRRCVRR